MDAYAWHRIATAPEPEPPKRQQQLRELSRSLASTLLPNPYSGPVTSGLTELVNDNMVRPPGSMTIPAVTGPFAAGKTTAVLSWAKRRYREWCPNLDPQALPHWRPDPGLEADFVPVVYLSLVSAAGIKELNSQILTFFGYPSEGTARVTTVRVNQALRRHGVRLLILDDAHMLRLTDRTSRQVLDYLKVINSELGFLQATMLLVCPSEDSTPVLGDPQIRARLRQFDLTPLDISSMHGRQLWQQLLHSAETLLLPHLPRARPGVLTSTHAALMWRRTQGYVGDATRLATAATLRAVAEGTNTITRDQINAVDLSQRAHDAEALLSRRTRANADVARSA